MPLKRIDRTSPALSGYLSAVRTYCRLGENTSQDALLSQLIDAALIEVEGRISGPVAITTYELTLDHQPALVLLPFTQTISVDKITVQMVDPDEDIEQEDNWSWDTWRVYLLPNETWSESDRELALMKIEFTAGYSAIPDEIILAVKMIAKWHFGNDITDYPPELQAAIDRTLAPFKRMRIG